MTYNLRFDKLKRQISETDIEGFILVTFSKNGKTKVVSTKKVISRKHFDKYFSKSFKRFKPTTVIDSDGINSTIEQIITNQNPFNIIKTGGFVTYCKNQLKFVTKQATLSGYTYTLNSFKSFLATKELEEIPFDQINITLFKEYKLFLETKTKLSAGTIKHYFIVLKGFINCANDDELCSINLPLKKFKLEENPKKPTVLDDSDIETLLKVERSNPKYIYVQFCLLQLFANGLRFSDCLLIKLKDFKPNYLKITTLKVKKELKIPYSGMMITIVSQILGFDHTPSESNLKNTLNSILNDVDNKTVIDYRREHILKYIKSQQNRFLFNFVPVILEDYDKTKPMSPDQNRKYIAKRTNFNWHLTQYLKSVHLSVDTLTSHSGRYAYTRLALQNDIPIHLISKSLGHASLSVTEKYIRQTFDVDDFTPISDMMTTKFKLQVTK